ncbi:MAG: helix-turn-helix domain-containing protein, partial [Oscillospiraceae bacterium]
LPPCDYLSTSDVALAFGVSSTKVTQWIEEGRLEAADLNTGTNLKTFWKIPRCSAIALAQSIAHGV